MIPNRYKQPDSWPHEFSPTTQEYQGDNGKMWRDMECQYCHKTYTFGKEAKPIGVCPARSDRKERQRLFK